VTLFDAFRYDGKRVLVVGAASGMGAALAELVQEAGAEVVVMDIAECSLAGSKEIRMDLADKASLDAAIDQCGEPLDALFLCAGVADGTAGIEKVNFLGHRYLIDRLLDLDALPRGSAIAFISSAAGLGWEADLELLNEYLDVADFELAAQWAVEHGKADYMWSKEAVCAMSPGRPFPCCSGASGSTPSAPVPPIPPWPGPTRRRGSASAPTTGVS
jgi:NAD(P)-dependent dehydrogenase (short-subunit alcohol dehydrogenase family)